MNSINTWWIVYQVAFAGFLLCVVYFIITIAEIAMKLFYPEIWDKIARYFRTHII